MTDTALANNIQMMMARYRHHFMSGNHVLRPGSQEEVAHGIIDYFDETEPGSGELLHTNGYLVAPGGLGKTIMAGDFFVGINTLPGGEYVLGHPTLGIPILITVDNNSLVDQWADKLLGELDEHGNRKPSVFGDRFKDKVGIYHSDLPEEEKRGERAKPVVIMTHDSAMILRANTNRRTRQPEPLIGPEQRGLVFVDEVDSRVRGDVTSQFYKDTFFGQSLLIGATATPLFRSGRTIGDYLFGGEKPIVEITHQEAVERQEIAPHINIIIEPEVDLSSDIKTASNIWGEEYPEEYQRRIIEQTGTDEALIEVIRHGTHPKTEKPLRDMMQMHQAIDVGHARYIAEKMNGAFGPGYAAVVWGDMNPSDHERIKGAFTAGEIKAVVQCKYWGRGTDFPDLEMTVQHAPSMSPQKVGQFHTRAARKGNGTKSAIYLSPFIPGIEQIVIGEMLGGLYTIPEGWEFPPTAGVRQEQVRELEPWPVIEGIKVHCTQRQLEMFATRLHAQRYINGLPEKQQDMLTLYEMAAQLDIDADILDKRIYQPLAQAYNARSARVKFVDIDPAEREDILYVRGRKFPVWKIGNYNDKGEEAFCISQELKGLCEYGLYGSLDNVPPHMLDKKIAAQFLKLDGVQSEALWHGLQSASLHREPYQSETIIGDIAFSYKDFGFYRNARGSSEFFITPDCLVPAYRLRGASKEEAERWSQTALVRTLKTSEWCTENDVIARLELNPISDRARTIRDVFKTLQQKARRAGPMQEESVSMGSGKQIATIACTKKWLPMLARDERNILCVHERHLDWFRAQVGMANGYVAASSARSK